MNGKRDWRLGGDGENGAFGVFDDLFGSAAAQGVEESVMPFGGHDDEVAVLGFAGVQNALYYVAFPGGAFGYPTRMMRKADVRRVGFMADEEKLDARFVDGEQGGEGLGGFGRAAGSWFFGNGRQDVVEADVASFRRNKALDLAGNEEGHDFCVAGDGLGFGLLPPSRQPRSLVRCQDNEVAGVLFQVAGDFGDRVFPAAKRFFYQQAGGFHHFPSGVFGDVSPAHQRFPDGRKVRPMDRRTVVADVQQGHFALAGQSHPQGMGKGVVVARRKVGGMQDFAERGGLHEMKKNRIASRLLRLNKKEGKGKNLRPKRLHFGRESF